MGCILKKQLRCKVIPKRPNFKLNPRSVPTMSRNSTITLQEQGQNLPKRAEVNCLKLHIQPPSEKFAFHELDLSKTQLYEQSRTFSELYNKIRILYSKFYSNLEQFYNASHIVCNKNKDLQGCLEILMLSVLTNKNIQCEIIQELPFIQVRGVLYEETRKLLADWVNLSKTLALVLEFQNEFSEKLKDLKEFQVKVKEYSSFVLKPYKLVKADRNLTCAFEAIEKMCAESLELIGQAAKFFEYKIKTVYKKLDKVASQENLAGNEIVHMFN